MKGCFSKYGLINLLEKCAMLGTLCLSHTLRAVGSEIRFYLLPYLQTSRLACYCFLDAARRYKFLGSETKDCITQHSKQHEYRCISFSSSDPTSHGGDTVGPDGSSACSEFASQLRNTEIGEHNTCIVSSPGLCPEGYQLQRQPQEMAWVNGQGLIVLTQSASLCRDARGPWWIASSPKWLNTKLAVILLSFSDQVQFSCHYVDLQQLN